jgi:hypothetical protein
MHRWEDVQSFVMTDSDNKTSTFNSVETAKAILALKDGNADDLINAKARLRDSLLPSISAAAMEGSYAQAYQHLTRLHTMQEIAGAYDFVKAATSGSHDDSLMRNVLYDWEERLTLIQPSLTTVEPILSMRREVLLMVAETCDGARLSAADSQLLLAKKYRTSGHLGAAQIALLEAAELGQLPSLYYFSMIQTIIRSCGEQVHHPSRWLSKDPNSFGAPGNKIGQSQSSTVLCIINC